MTPKKLKKIREKLRMSQMELAKRAKISRYNISMFESNYRKFTDDELSKVNKVLNGATND